MLWFGISVGATTLADTMIAPCHLPGKTCRCRQWSCVLLLVGVLGAVTLLAQEVRPEPESSGRSATYQGVVTWIDGTRSLVVLQDGAQAKALRVDLPQLDFSVGDWVGLEGRESPLITALPDYPHAPAGSGILPTFEAPTNWSDFYVTRVRGYLHPPTSGNYTFWIASDDSSELCLSTDASAANARRIAFVGTGRFTQSRAWGTYPTQKSREIFLQAGATYYLEALHQDQAGVDFLAVAWQGPGLEQAVIEGRYLTPFQPPDDRFVAKPSNPDPTATGVLREYWTNFFSSDLAVLGATNEFIAQLSGARLVSRRAGVQPAPVRMNPDQIIRPEQNFRRVETVGRLSFRSQPDVEGELELTDWPARISVRFAGAAADLLKFPEKSQLRVRGVCEAARDAAGELRASVIWVTDPADIAWVDSEENWAQHKPLPAHLLTAANTSLRPGQSVRIRGTVVGPESDGAWRLQADDVFRGYLSNDGTNWREIGSPVELAVSNSVLTGFAIASHHVTEAASARFEQIRGLAGPMQEAQIGTAGSPGRFDFDGTSLQIEGGGWNFWNLADQCYYVFRPMDGAGEIVARLTSLKTSDQLGKVALMMRQTLNASSVWAGMMRMPGERIGFQGRRETGGRVAGSVVYEAGEWAKLTRHRSQFLLRTRHGDPLQVGEPLDILGTLAWKGDEVLLADAMVRPFGGKAVASALASAATPSAPTSDIANVRIKDLMAEDERAELEARTRRFRIKGVVTYIDQSPGGNLFFVQDDSGGGLVRLLGRMPRHAFEPGQLVELTGVVPARGVTPEFLAQGCAVVGRANLPVPLKHPFESVVQERRNGQWVELEGVGRSLNSSGELVVMTREGLVFVVAGAESAGTLAACVNSLVRLRGVFWDNGKPMLLVSSPRGIEIAESAPPDPFAVPGLAIAALSNLDLEPWAARRRKIAGVVTCKRDDLFMVQDASGGIAVETDSPAAVEIGDGVEVVGFLSERAFGPELSGAQVRKLGLRSLPVPLELSAEGGLNRSNNMQTVALEAVLLQTWTQDGIQTLDLQGGQRAFRAFLPLAAGRLPAIVNGSKVRVTGVSQIEGVDPLLTGAAAAEQPLVAKLELLLRTPGDLVVLQRPPWWNWKHTAALIGVSVLGAITAVIWIRTLRRRVEQRTSELRETMVQLQKETQVSATLAERDRLAGEIHDSVEQGLSAIIMQMDTAAKLVHRPEEVSRYLILARNMAGFSRSEVHHAVWGLQSPLLDNADLPTALRRVAQDISAGDSPQVTVEVAGEMQVLPRAIEHHLLRAAQEAITNAVKHGRPNTIQVALTYADDRLRFQVRDDGCGFDPQAVSVGISHFGLRGLQVRSKKIKGQLTIASQPGAGTSIEIIVPLPSARAAR